MSDIFADICSCNLLCYLKTYGKMKCQVMFFGFFPLVLKIIIFIHDLIPPFYSLFNYLRLFIYIIEFGGMDEKKEKNMR